ncbi:xanthine dehydrogenase accessory factor [Ketogulonicigenium robustum]|uniref:Xanthine dehydrogenase accessory factor n=1 Tax=Ketogulonicigenium robustum TaxID=92947 RepID=A0A1W6NWJ7_9RHOB|nr:xanthine dehydrogenase accessory protein XdhC [Ketogulonicigenium robustum]ARO13638.1 xanthine dehydrogenase accessory factor [Ketogulonicigenium robustum]
MSLDLPALTRAVQRHARLVRVLVLRHAGSVPRETGTSMLVSENDLDGTIGGGRLEEEAITAARALLAEGGPAALQTYPLGPRLGQCCGGSVTLLYEVFTAANLPSALPYARPIDPAAPPPPHLTPLPDGNPRIEGGWIIEGPPPLARPLWLFGAGHVGRAIVSILAPLNDRQITWVDTAPDRFPPVEGNVTPLVAADPALVVRYAPSDADHLIMTYSHDFDFALCHALLQHGFHSAGLIGSDTKWVRFQRRLAALGHSDAQIQRITCPIGDPALGKRPQAIAIGVIYALLKGKELA